MINTSKKNPTAIQNQKVAENSKREKTERKSSPEPDSRPNSGVSTGPKQSPSTRAPTRTPSGEKGPEDSWLRVLKVSDQSFTKDRPNRIVL